MKSLILKDLYNIYHNMKSLALMLVLFLFILIPTSGIEAYIPFACLICSTMIITTFSFDDLSKWTKYAMIMPISKKEYVLSKYIVSFIFSCFGAVSGFILAMIGGFVAQKVKITKLEDIIFYFAMTGIGLLVTLLFNGLSILLLFKYGAEKARILTLVAYVIPIGILFGIYKLLVVIGVEFTETVIIGILWSLPIIAIIWNYAMYQICYRIFEKKELI